MNYVLPSSGYCSLNFMLGILSKVKKGLKTVADEDAIEYKKHTESL